MKPEVRRVFDANFKAYGVRKVWRQMQREGFDIARCTVERLMRDMGLQGVIQGKLVKTTANDKAAPCLLDQVNRQFHAPVPNMLWVSDLTYVATWAGFVYVAFVIDVYARYIVGWRVSRTAHASFVPDALEQAIHDRRSVHPGDLIHHNDRGSQYVSPTAMTTPRPRRSMVSTRPRSSIGEFRGDPLKRLNTQPSNGWTGSTTADCSRQSTIFHPPKPRSITTPGWTTRP
jgi:transposase InsO family protein